MKRALRDTGTQGARHGQCKSGNNTDSEGSNNLRVDTVTNYNGGFDNRYICVSVEEKGTRSILTKRHDDGGSIRDPGGV